MTKCSNFSEWTRPAQREDGLLDNGGSTFRPSDSQNFNSSITRLCGNLDIVSFSLENALSGLIPAICSCSLSFDISLPTPTLRFLPSFLGLILFFHSLVSFCFLGARHKNKSLKCLRSQNNCQRIRNRQTQGWDTPPPLPTLRPTVMNQRNGRLDTHTHTHTHAHTHTHTCLPQGLIFTPSTHSVSDSLSRIHCPFLKIPPSSPSAAQFCSCRLNSAHFGSVLLALQ